MTDLHARPARVTAADWKYRADRAADRETMARAQAERRRASTVYDTLPDDLRADYDAELRRALLAVAGVHGTYAALYRERQFDAARDEADRQTARDMNAGAA